MLFGTEAPGSGSTIRPETGTSADDLVPAIDAFEFLSEQDKLDLFDENPARLFPAMAKRQTPREAVDQSGPRADSCREAWTTAETRVAPA
jgi:hypothetical protein